MLRVGSAQLRQEGRLDRVRRTLERADALCPSEQGSTAPLRVQALVELGRFGEARTLAGAWPDAAHAASAIAARESAWAGLDPAAVASEGLRARARGDSARARELFDQSYALATERAGTEPRLLIHDGMPGSLVAVLPEGAALLSRDDQSLIAWSPALTHPLWSLRAEHALFAVSEDGRSILDVKYGEPVPGRGQHVVAARGRVRRRESSGPWLDVEVDLEALAWRSSTLTLSPDGAWLVECRDSCQPGSFQACLRFHDTTTARVRDARIEGSCRDRVTISAARCAVHGTAGGLEVIDMAAGKHLLNTSAWQEREARGHDATTMVMTGGIPWVAFLPNNQALAALWDGKIFLHPIPSRARAPASARFKAPGTPLLTFGSGTLLLSWDRDDDAAAAGQWRFYNLVSRQELARVPADRSVEALVPGWQAQDFVAVHNDNSVWQHQLDGRKTRLVEPGHTRAARSVRISDAGKLVSYHGPDFEASWGQDSSEDRAAAEEPWPAAPVRHPAAPGVSRAKPGTWDVRLGTDGILRLLTERGRFDLSSACPGRVVDAAPHPRLPLLAVACSSGARGEVRLLALEGDGATLLATLRTDGAGVRYAIDGEGFVEELQGRVDGHALCAAGNLVLPLQVCQERRLVRGMVGQWLTGRRPSYRS
jgi:hypothetical protein